MVINSISAPSLAGNPISAPKPNTQSAPSIATDSASGLNLSVSAEYLAASASPITTEDGAQQSLDLARNGILNQSSLALLAHGQLQAQTVMDLLAQ